jgi:hypothetical protein
MGDIPSNSVITEAMLTDWESRYSRTRAQAISDLYDIEKAQTVLPSGLSSSTYQDLINSFYANAERAPAVTVNWMAHAVTGILATLAGATVTFLVVSTLNVTTLKAQTTTSQTNTATSQIATSTGADAFYAQNGGVKASSTAITNGITGGFETLTFGITAATGTFTNATSGNLGAINFVATNIYATGTTSLLGVSFTSATGSSLILTGTVSSTGMIVGAAGTKMDFLGGTTTWIDFPAVSAGQCSVSSTRTLVGASLNDVVKISSSNTFKNVASTTEPEAWVQSADTIAVRLCDRDKTMPVADPPDAQFTIIDQSF